MLEDERTLRLDGQDRPPRLLEILDGVRTDGGNVESHVMPLLGQLHHREAALATQLSRPDDIAIGALDPLHSDRRFLQDGDALPYVEVRHPLGDIPAKANVFKMFRLRLDTPYKPLLDEQLGTIPG